MRDNIDLLEKLVEDYYSTDGEITLSQWTVEAIEEVIAFLKEK